MSGFAELQNYIQGNFQNLPLNGQVSQEELADLVKALNVGSDRDPPSTAAAGDGFAWRVEDLDPLQRITTFDAKHIVLWKMIQKTKTSNTVFEWNEVQSYGEDGYDGFMQDGTLPELMDSTVFRRFGYVKFMGVQGAITHGSTLVRSADGNLVAAETERKTMKLLQLMERALHYGDSSLDSVQFDGFFTQMKNAVTDGRAASTQIKDMRGKPLSVEAVEEGAGVTSAAPNYGILTDLFCNPLVKSNMTSGLLPYNRAAQGVGSTNGAIGASFDKVVTSIGNIEVHPNSFIDFGSSPSSTGLGDAIRRPPTPVLSTAVTASSNAASQFAASDAGDYTYSVVARNRYGASVPLSVGSVTAAAGDKVTFGITAAPGNQTLYFEIYRSEKDGDTEYLIAKVANPNGLFTAVTINDYNADLPNTSMALAVQWERSVLDFKQLAPFMKIMLGQVDLNYRWVQCCYGAPALYQPKKCYLIKNIGRATIAA